MNRYYLEITVQASGFDTGRLETMFDPLADAVYDLGGVVDADLAARFGDAEFDFTMAVDADDAPSALTAGLAAVRCALHAVGESTPGWEDQFAAIQHLVRSEPAAA